jgi:hypothetical protein
MLAKARTAAQTRVWARVATPASARRAPAMPVRGQCPPNGHASASRLRGPPRRVCEITGPLGRCSTRQSGIEPDLRTAPTSRPVLSQTRPTGVLQRVPRRSGFKKLQLGMWGRAGFSPPAFAGQAVRGGARVGQGRVNPGIEQRVSRYTERHSTATRLKPDRCRSGYGRGAL